MEESGPNPPGGTISGPLARIAKLLEGDPKIAATRARDLLRRFPGQAHALTLLVSARRLAGDL